MPYKSKAQMRFFHSEGAAEAGITPATVKKWDEHSRGKKIPEKVGSFLDNLLFKIALNGVSSGTSSGTAMGPGIQPVYNNLDSTKALKSNNETFQNNAIVEAQLGSKNKLQAGEHLTMPVKTT